MTKNKTGKKVNLKTWKKTNHLKTKTNHLKTKNRQ